MSLKDTIIEDTKTAMRNKDASTLGTLRLLQAAIKQKEIDDRITLDDAGIVTVLQKMLKQRQDSIEAFRQANRQDLLDKEEMEVKVLNQYMPQQLSNDEITEIIDAAITNTSASGMQDMGKVMGIVKEKIAGRANMAEVSQIIKSRLS
ncbi:MAG: GatB/YqeY domain-containing protein [Methylophilaceae bacterium]|jgi:uncharacterized protein YqeY